MKKSVKQELNKILKKYNYKNIDKIDWDYISQHQKLSKSFIREFKNKVNWVFISAYQELSFEFISEFKDKLNLDKLLERNLITQEDIEKIYKPVNRFELIDI